MFEQRTLIELSTANQEVVGRKFTLCVLAPSFFQPGNVGLKTTRSHDAGFGGDALGAQDFTRW